MRSAPTASSTERAMVVLPEPVPPATPIAKQAEPGVARAEPLLRQIGDVAGRPQFVYLSSCVFLALFGAYGIAAWLPTYLRNDFGFNIAAAGAVASIVNLGLITASPLAGMLSDRLGTRVSS